MAGPKKTVAGNQERLAAKGREASRARQSAGANEIAEKTNMKRQGKEMHRQSGKK